MPPRRGVYEQPPFEQTYEQQPMYQPPPGYGYGYGMRQFAHRPRRMYPLDTKPFFLTSEFGVSLVAAVLIAITAASSDSFGAWRAWILITAIVAAYSLSRGLAKAGTRSHVSGSRENHDLVARQRTNGQQQQ
jgi:hypothetical protein